MTDTDPMAAAASAFLEAQKEGIRPKGGIPDVPVEPIPSRVTFIPMRDGRTGAPAVCLRFSTNLGAFHFIWGADAVRRMAKELDEVAVAAELLPDPPTLAVPEGNGRAGGLIVPEHN